MTKNSIIRVIVLVLVVVAALVLLYHCAGGFKIGVEDGVKNRGR